MATLCLATDLGMGFPVEHGLHATVVAARLAQRLGVDPETARDAYYGSMLFYLGCTADAEVAAELFDEGMLLTHFVPVIFGRPQETVRGIVRGLGDPAATPLVRAAQGVSRLPGAARGHREHMTAMCEVAELLCDRLGVPRSVRGLFEHLPERGTPSRSQSSSATSHIAVMCCRWPRAAPGSRATPCAARTNGDAAGSPSPRTMPRSVSCGRPKITGMKCVSSMPSSKSSALTSESAVQPR